MTTAELAPASTRPAWLALDKLGVLIALIAVAGAALPFALFRANRIVLGEPRSLLEALPSFPSGALIGILLVGFAVALLRFPVVAKLVGGFLVLAVLLVCTRTARPDLRPRAGSRYHLA